MRLQKQTWIFIAIASVLCVLDQFFKWLVDAAWIPGKSQVIISKVLAFTFSQNSGAAFGMLQGWTAFLIVFSMGVLVAIVYYFKKIPVKLLPAVALITGGAISNLIDRVLLGHVVDYIQFFSWPTFNLADAGITVGTLIVGVWLLRSE